ncbi:MAG TPA: hypothetical protein VHM48_01295 [Candidatus Limnocylindrales bacterium]|nr:hypothetical protein [Candidatus Limnocylindrales bacterium]
MTTIDDMVVDVGDQTSAAEREAWPDRARTRAVFDAGAFEPEVAAAIARYHTLRAISDAYPGWRGVLRVRGLSITWPEWRQLPAADRKFMIERLAAWSPAVVINGSTVAQPRIQLPVLELVFGSRIRTDAG